MGEKNKPAFECNSLRVYCLTDNMFLHFNEREFIKLIEN